MFKIATIIRIELLVAPIKSIKIACYLQFRNAQRNRRLHSVASVKPNLSKSNPYRPYVQSHLV